MAAPNWTPDEITYASKAWAEGCSGAMIAGKLGRTRCSVLGYMWRHPGVFPPRPTMIRIDRLTGWKRHLRALAPPSRGPRPPRPPRPAKPHKPPPLRRGAIRIPNTLQPQPSKSELRRMLAQALYNTAVMS